MAVTTWRSPASEGQIQSEFTNPTNMFSSDDSDAVCKPADTGIDQNDYHNFGFDAEIGTGDTIEGIQVRVEGSVHHDGDEAKLTTTLVKGGSVHGNAKDIGNFVFGADQTLSSPTVDLWGGTWTAADVRASTFGCDFLGVLVVGGGGLTLNLDHVQIQITFSTGGAIPVMMANYRRLHQSVV
jgi:hypothetical protein